MLRKQLVNLITLNRLVFNSGLRGIQVLLERRVLVLQLPPSLVNISELLKHLMDPLPVLAVDVDHVVDVSWFIAINIIKVKFAARLILRRFGLLGAAHFGHAVSLDPCFFHDSW